MGYQSPDWNQAATIASGNVRAIGGAQRDSYNGTAGSLWTELPFVNVSSGIAWTIKNTGNEKIEIGLGTDVAVMELEAGESWSPPWNGKIYVRRAGSVDSTYRAVAVGV